MGGPSGVKYDMNAKPPPAFLAQAGKGRPKGALNKSTQLAKHAIATAAEGLGGAARMIEWAKESPENERVFWQSIYTKLVPVQNELSGPDGGAIETRDVTLDSVITHVSSLTGADRDTALRGIAASGKETVQ